MKDYKTFIFDAYAFDEKTGVISLKYSLDDEVAFEETFTLPNTSQLAARSSQLNEALFGLHLICGISYYKATLPKKIEIRSGTLNEEQAKFWNTVYTKGLGEFFYKNDIDFRDLIHFPSEGYEQRVTSQPATAERAPRTLVPFGGGKDSFVTAEMLKEEGKDVTLLRMGSHPLIDASIKATGLPSLAIERKISPELLKLNEQGALNGHIPVTAIVSWLSVVAALVYDFDTIAMSNEKSANVGNAILHGMEVNHQWSKGSEFETMMRDYVKRYVSPHLQYESALREFTELEIVKRFVKHENYLPLAVSCNKNWTLAAHSSQLAASNWCGTCPKCAFVFALYAAFLPKERVIEIFGRNLLDEKNLEITYSELLGLTGIKPFECVGTSEETHKAFRLIQKRGEFNDTVAMKRFLSL